MPARSTLVPALCDSLVAMFSAAAPSAVAALPANDDGSPAELDVFDGPPVGHVPAAYVAVGYSAASAGPAYTASTGLAVESTYGLSDVGNRVYFENPAVLRAEHLERRRRPGLDEPAPAAHRRGLQRDGGGGAGGSDDRRCGRTRAGVRGRHWRAMASGPVCGRRPGNHQGGRTAAADHARSPV